MSEDEKPPENTSSRGISRRDALKRIGGAALTGGVLVAAEATGITHFIPNGKPESKSVDDIQTQTPERQIEDIIWQRDGITVWGKGSGEELVPSKWQDARGNTGEFNIEEITEAGREAVAYGEAQLAASALVFTESPVIHSTTEKITQAPEDMLSPEELHARGITIVNPAGVEIGFRESAFLPGEILDTYKEGGQNKLTVIVVDAPGLNRDAFEGPEYDSVRALIDNVYKAEHNQSPSQIRNYLTGRLTSSSEAVRKTYDKNTELAKARQVQNFTDEDIRQYGIYPGQIFGLYLPQDHQWTGGTAAVFLAVGERPQLPEVLAIEANSIENNYNIRTVPFNLEDDMVLSPARNPKPEDTYPQSSDFTVLDPKSRNLFTGGVESTTKTSIFTAGHELMHDYRARHDLQPYEDEGETDLDTLNHIARAEEFKAQTGSDELYYLVQRDVDDGFYVLG